MNVKDLLALAGVTPDAYIEAPEYEASAALVGDVVIATPIAPKADEEITVSVHTHDGDREEAARCFADLAMTFERVNAGLPVDVIV